MKLWIFGQSMCLPFNVLDAEGWPSLLSNQLGIEYNNTAQPGADNFFIYHCFLENLKLIEEDDIVIIGWSHYSRKSFVFDCTNTQHRNTLKNSLHYKTQTKDLFRSRNLVPNSKDKWLTLQPMDSGDTFYDTWFNHYYSDYEQKCNFQSYLDSVQLRAPKKYIPFYFSKEIVSNINTLPGEYMLEFTIKNKVELSNSDYHINSLGHSLWAKLLYNKI